MDHRLRKSVRNQCIEIFIEDLQWKVCVGQVTTGGVPCGRGSAIVCAKNARTTATERAENFIFKLWIWFLRWGSLDDVFHQVIYTTSEIPLLPRQSPCIKFYPKYSSYVRVYPWHFPERRALITHDSGSLKIWHKDYVPWAKKLGLPMVKIWSMKHDNWFEHYPSLNNYDYYQLFGKGAQGS